jgi:hypothetical protein
VKNRARYEEEAALQVRSSFFSIYSRQEKEVGLYVRSSCCIYSR